MRRINSANDQLINSNLSLEGTLTDFLVWAYSDLCDDANKGVFAEWLVAKILDIPTQRRYLWANSDLLSREGIKIEVKASAYWQSWKALDPDGSHKDLSKVVMQPDSKIRFSNLITKDTIYNSIESAASLKSDLYCFCFHNEKNYQQWNAMDIEKWEFYLVKAEAIKTKSVSLKWLKDNKFGPYSPSELRDAFDEIRRALPVGMLCQR
jgi:hypothetical protein